mmetsp:Transcript_3559/g.7392  ORF Transcript_3559/g.7392 Transcript_3559/m.7392 type:complete len:260 (+) Transcript_3559:219-998(+)
MELSSASRRGKDETTRPEGRHACWYLGGGGDFMGCGRSSKMSQPCSARSTLFPPDTTCTLCSAQTASHVASYVSRSNRSEPICFSFKCLAYSAGFCVRSSSSSRSSVVSIPSLRSFSASWRFSSRNASRFLSLLLILASRSSRRRSSSSRACCSMSSKAKIVAQCSFTCFVIDSVIRFQMVASAPGCSTISGVTHEGRRLRASALWKSSSPTLRKLSSIVEALPPRNRLTDRHTKRRQPAAEASFAANCASVSVRGSSL